MKQLIRFFVPCVVAILLLSVVSCSNEQETDGGNSGIGVPDNPQANDPTRRSVVMALQNKLIVAQAEADNTRAGSIAEADENRIGSLDIYAFGSDAEEGPYTFQELFSYRADNGTLPAGASPIDLTPDEVTGKINVIFYPKKGLYTKFYCVANTTKLLDATGHEYANYLPLQQDATGSGSIGNAVVAAGVPTETDFLTLTTPLLDATNTADVLLAPLPMSGANSQPTDLRDYNQGTYVRLNVRLTRAVARFDVTNKAEESHFTITEVSMGNGRRGAGLFPIRPAGDTPATPAQLITYPDRAFNGTDANKGTTTKAFYSYPGPAGDGGYLILKGTYALNQTDTPKEVSYTVPFERITDGNGTRIEINHNHRYTIQITQADPFKLEVNILVADWDDGSGVDDYEPDNKLDGITVDNLLPAGETTWTELTSTINLSLKPGSSFDVATGSNAGVTASLSYANGSVAANNWLKVENVPLTREGTQKAKFTVSLNESYAEMSYPQAILTLADKAGGEEAIIIILPVAKPLITASTATATGPGKDLNSLDADASVIELYRVTDSQIDFTLSCPDGMEDVTPPSGFTLEKLTGSTDKVIQYRLKLTNREVVVTDNKITLEFKNKKDNSLTSTLTVNLHDASLTDISMTPAAAGNATFDSANQKVTMNISENSAFTMNMKAYDNVSVESIPDWLVVNTNGSTTRSQVTSTGIASQLAQNTFTSPRAAAEPNKYAKAVRFSLKPGVSKFSTATVTLKNKCGGPDYTFTVVPEYNKPAIEAATMNPTVNSYVSGSKSLNLYQLKQNNYSTAQLKITSWGGSLLTLPAGVEADLTQSEANVQTYTIKYRITDTNYTLSDITGKTLTVKNLSDNSKSEVIAITIKTSIPTATASLSGISFSRTATTMVMNLSDSDTDLMGIKEFNVTLTSPVGYTFSGYSNSTASDNQSVTATGSQGGSMGRVTNTFKFAFTGTSFDKNTNLWYFKFTAKDTKFPDYQIDEYTGTPVINGSTTYRVGDFYIIEAIRVPVNTYINAVNTANMYSRWRVPSVEDMRVIIGWTSSNYDYYDNYDVRACGTSKTLLNRILTYSATFYTTLDVGTTDRSYVYSIHYDPDTNKANYAHALKTTNNRYLIIRDVNQ